MYFVLSFLLLNHSFINLKLQETLQLFWNKKIQKSKKQKKKTKKKKSALVFNSKKVLSYSFPLKIYVFH